MQFTNRVIYDVVPALVAFLKHEIPIKLAHDVSLVLGMLRPQQTRIQELRDTLIDRYGKKKDGKPIFGTGPDGMMTVQLEQPEKFEAEWTELLDQVVEFKVRPISLKQLGDDFRVAGWIVDAMLVAGLIDDGEKKPKRAPSRKGKG